MPCNAPMHVRSPRDLILASSVVQFISRLVRGNKNFVTITMDFKEAAERVKNLTKRPTDNELLEIYGLYKQATEGDVNIPRPGIFDMKGKAKWDRWNEVKGMPREEAEAKYVAAAQKLIDKYGQ